MKLVIVESPTKAKTIGKFLGKDFKVESSFGHVRDLPRGKLGVDVENNFEPHYVIPTKARKRVTHLKKQAEKVDEIILAVDEDREGEAIAYHLTKVLKDPGRKKSVKPRDWKMERIVFHEITKDAITKALESSRKIDMNLVDAQQARRVLDRLVGYNLSPFLWKKIFRGLSAGRVQSVALRIIVEREEEIRAFKPEEYWTIVASLLKIKAKSSPLKKDLSSAERFKSIFEANLHKIDGKALEKLDVKTKKQADNIVANLEKADFKVLEARSKDHNKNPLPPFITSTIQQEAHKRLHFSAKQTMMMAQRLYEHGFITYMRTDSVNLSAESLTAVHDWISKEFGKGYLIERPRVFKKKSRLAQEAHEAIRPTDPGVVPKNFGGKGVNLGEKESKLYDLIWRRFVASQLPQAVFETTSVDIEAKSGSVYGLRANGNALKFDGFIKVWPVNFTEVGLPSLKSGDELEADKVKGDQHFTEPPARYNEASLVKALESHGIGRPSTYAPIISVIQNRNYVQKNEQGRFEPTETGELVNTMLTDNFPNIVDIDFTARMEEELDDIAEGTKGWRETIGKFYEPFEKNLEEKYKQVKELEMPDEETDEVCDKCGKPMIIKRGRFGKFIACSGFPECKTTKSLATKDNSLGDCPDCTKGKIIMKRTKKKRVFYGCSEYPDCEYASWKKPGEDGEEKDGEGKDA